MMRTKENCKFCVPMGEHCCGAQQHIDGLHQPFICTRPMGHEGQHVACSLEEHGVAVWGVEHD